MAESGKLYTPQMLSLAVELAKWPPSPALPLHGEARSPTCGSTIAIDLATGTRGEIVSLGMRVRACAVGQAAAAIFARHAVGRNGDDVEEALLGLASWLAGKSSLPEWPDIALIEAAQGFPGRHGAIQLPWRAALSALSSTGSGR